MIDAKKTQKEYGSLLEQFDETISAKGKRKVYVKQQLNHFKTFHAWKEQLEIEAEETVKHLKTDSNLADPNDRATQESESDWNLEHVIEENYLGRFKSL